ncbi:MAG: hypothetical protein KDH15_07810 [Rhodocyclaceae bacterium]|nr:hypothetical protein [Rhodocyclaceae bacterium]
MMQKLARELSLVLIFVAAVIACSPAFSATPQQTRWLCWYNNDTTMRCVLRMAAVDADAAERSVRIAAAVPGAQPLPGNVRDIIRAEQSIVGAEVVIPMFNHPEDPGLMEQLASFSMCYGKSDCTVDFWQPVTVVAMLD